MSAQQKPRVDEEDDLDDLDDVLDQFSPPAQAAPPASASASMSPQPVADTNEEALTSEFTAQLAEGMESLFRELGLEPGATAGSQGAPQERFKAAWEAMLVEGMDGMVDPSASTSHARTPADTASSPRPSEDNFQSRIRSTVSRLRESESGLQSSDSSASAGGEPLQSLLSQLEGLGDPLSGDGAESEEQLQEVLEAMMGQLMSKDVLYEPLKELYDKFPEYLTKNASTISPQDKARYEAQISCIKRLIDAFEERTYRDEDGKAREKIVELMNELQSHGQPPEDVIGPLPPGLSMGSDGLPDMPDGCKLN